MELFSPLPHPLGSSTTQGSPCLGPGHALTNTLFMGKLWKEMTPLMPEEGSHFGGSCVVSYSPLLPSQCSACHGVPWPGSHDTFPRDWASWV